MLNWNNYLQSICEEYAEWWTVYTITDVQGRIREEKKSTPLLFDFELMVETVERETPETREKQEKIERLTVLDGLRKYSSNHVLLVGKPGSGKSTALVRLLLEDAEKSRRGSASVPTPSRSEKSRRGSASVPTPSHKGNHGGIAPTGSLSKIPILVELRYYKTSILDLIEAFLQRHDPNLNLDADILKTWLRQGQLLLLIDGVNELPSEAARRDLQAFRQDFQKNTRWYSQRGIWA